MTPYGFNLLYTLKRNDCGTCWGHRAPLARCSSRAFWLFAIWLSHNKSISWTDDVGTHIVSLSCSWFGLPTWLTVMLFPTDLESVFNQKISKECENVDFSKCDCHAFVFLLLFILLLFIFLFVIHLFVPRFLQMLYCWLWVQCICGALYM